MRAMPNAERRNMRAERPIHTARRPRCAVAGESRMAAAGAADTAMATAQTAEPTAKSKAANTLMREIRKMQSKWLSKLPDAPSGRHPDAGNDVGEEF